jgi:hypothetical protein
MVTNNLLQNNLPSAHRSSMKPQEVDAPFKNLSPELKTLL